MTQENIERWRCQATRRDGQPCRAWASKTTGFCPLHSPESRQIQVRGGQSKSRAHMLETRMNPSIKPVVDLLSQSVREVHEGTITPSQGQAIAALGSSLIKAVESAELAIRMSVVEMRLNSGWREVDEFGP